MFSSEQSWDNLFSKSNLKKKKKSNQIDSVAGKRSNTKSLE